MITSRSRPAGAKDLGVDRGRRALLTAACFLPLVNGSRAGATPVKMPWVNVNLQGLDGGQRIPGREGTDYFAATPQDLRYVAERTTGASRLPFRWERLQPQIGGPLDASYLGEITRIADAAASIGRTVLIDCHNYMRRSVDGVDRIVGARDKVLTAAHLADMWHRVASALGRHQGIAGWDIMNEPHDLGDAQDLAQTMQMSVDAIDAVETAKIIFIEGNSWSSAERWVAANPGYPLRDGHDRITYSAHCYADKDASGTHFEYAALPPSRNPDSILVDRSRPFVTWCTDHHLRGNIGETNVGRDDPRWNDILDRGIAFWLANGISVNLWLFGSRFGANPFNLFPVDGVEAPQWAVVTRHIGAPGRSR